MKVTKRQLKRIIKEEMLTVSRKNQLVEQAFPDNREVQWKLIDELVGKRQHSDLERAEALRDLADELEDRHHDEGAELGF